MLDAYKSTRVLPRGFSRPSHKLIELKASDDVFKEGLIKLAPTSIQVTSGTVLVVEGNRQKTLCSLCVALIRATSWRALA